MIKLKWTPDKSIKILKEELLQIKDTVSDREYKNWCNKNMSKLPTVDIPKHIDTCYPIWAMDNEGFCLVGDFEIEHINEIEKHYEEE
jgi:hypothetical protein